jgi:hypothetical protein
MRKSVWDFTLDIKQVQVQDEIDVKQGDTDNEIQVSLVDGTKAYIIDEKCYALFSAIKPDGSKIGNHCYIEKNKIYCPVTEQTVGVTGRVECEVSLYDAEGGLITSPRFNLCVFPRIDSNDDFTSSSEFTSLAECLTIVRAAEESRKATENERETAEAERQALWNTPLTDPKIWELESGMYRVSGFVACDKEGLGFAVYDNSPLIITKDGDKTIFYLYLGGYGELPYDIITGSTDGTTCEWFGIESDRKKDTIIDKYATHEGYPSTLAVYEFAEKLVEDIPLNEYEATKNKVTTIDENSTDEQYPSAKAVYEFAGSGLGGGITSEQITALDNMFKIAAFTENPTSAYNSFKEAFGITDDTNTEDVTITLSANTLTFNEEESQTLTATVTPSNITDDVVWTSSNNAVATVENGIVTPVSDGSCIITASVGLATAECSVTVSLVDSTEWKQVWEFTDENGSDISTVFAIGNPHANNTAELRADGFFLESVNSSLVSVNSREAKNASSTIIEVEARIDTMGTHNGGYGFNMKTGNASNYAFVSTGNNKIFQAVGTTHNQIGSVSADNEFHTYRLQSINGVHKICFDGVDLTGDYTNGCTDGYGGHTGINCHFGASATIRAMRVWYE